MKKSIAFALASTLLATALSAADVAPVMTHYGPVQGVSEGDLVV